MNRGPRVAICQSHIIPGGRLRVVLEIIDILNRAGIVPDVLTMKLGLDPGDIGDKYHAVPRANWRVLPHIPRLPRELTIALYNLSLRHYGAPYDLLVNTNNSIIFLPPKKPVLTYMFFPRKRRIMADVVDIHIPGSHFKPWSRIGVQRALLRRLYHYSAPCPQHQLVCMTAYTRNVMREEYKLPDEVEIIYPPVDMAAYHRPGTRVHQECAVVTAGRFVPNKRQLEQIELAAELPHIPFHIAGFVSDARYYERCRRYVEDQALSNVHLHPDASFDVLLSLFHQARYFLHTLINEPFGLTAVQAIAAGCIPIVHDSGGQREVVTLPQLRYRNLNEVPGILDSLEEEASTLDSLRASLQSHVAESFERAVFVREMAAILSEYAGLKMK